MFTCIIYVNTEIHSVSACLCQTESTHNGRVFACIYEYIMEWPFDMLRDPFNRLDLFSTLFVTTLGQERKGGKLFLTAVHQK